jgi:two-component system chemotaxis response regulator CheB
MVDVSVTRPGAERESQRSPDGVGELPLRRFSPCTPSALFIGASTGGPQALATLFKELAPHLDAVPVFVVLHMPTDFTSVVAAQIERLTGRATIVAKHGESPCPGTIYFAPGGTHMRLLRLGSSLAIVHKDSPPENFCKPSVDVLFRSAAAAYGPSTLGLVLTGMGTDGLAGSRAIVAAGGSLIVQDEASSVVWGMPGAVAQAGLASAILPLARIAVTISGLLKGSRSRGAA